MEIKKEKVMKRFGVCLAVAVLVLAVAGCNNGSKEQIAKLQSSVDSLTAESEEKSKTINEFFASINAIEESLAEVRSKEQAIGSDVMNYKNEEIPGDARSKINDNIVAINDIMARNRQRIAKLTASLKKSNIEASELQRIIKSTEQKLNERDSTVNLLKSQLESLNFSVDSLNMVLDTLSLANEELSEMVASKDAKINEGWYAVGKRSELIENKVIENRLLQKNYRILRDFNRDYFTQINISQTESIPLFSTSSATVVTSHPSGSYTLEKDADGNVKSLVITDKEAFWSASRYLVVVVQ